MGKTILWILLSGLAFNPAVRADEAAVCETYRTLQGRLQCDPDGYLIRTGYRLCLEFVRVDGEFSPAGRLAMAKIRRCLTASLGAAGNRLTCENAEQVGYDSHVDCYVTAGFCELSLEDKAVTFTHLGSMLLEVQPWEQFLKLSAACTAR